MRSDHKALLFLGAIAVLGAGVRLARAAGRNVDDVDAAALRRQMHAADSAKGAATAKAAKAAEAQRAAKRGGARQSTGTGGKRPPRASAAPSADAASAGQTISHRDARGRLDLDVATLAEIDSLPGIGPTLAKRIVVERIAHGPFIQLVALGRVKGLGKRQIARLDTLVTFSGRTLPVSPGDTTVPKRRRR